jgi:hypothetical protein
MAVDYTTFPPVGQIDDTSCWAACLSWWLTANNKPPETQEQLFDDYHALFNPDGTISPDTFKAIAATPKFNMQVAQFEIGDIQHMRDNGVLPLTSTPNIIGWNKFVTGKGLVGLHMNAVFNQRAGSSGKIVTCMEPYFPDPGVDYQRTGQFIDRDIGFFLNTSPIWIGCAN